MAEMITYDTIRNVHRTEKNQITLQKLPENFFSLAKAWLEQKQSMARKDTLALLEIENAKKLMDDLLNRRERKIVISALHTARGSLPPENMTADEEKFFDEIVDILKKFKQNMKEQFDAESVIEEKIEFVREFLETKAGEGKTEEIGLRIKIISDLPKFVDNDLKSYGPYKPGDSAELPRQLAEILIGRGVAEEIK